MRHLALAPQPQEFGAFLCRILLAPRFGVSCREEKMHLRLRGREVDRSLKLMNPARQVYVSFCERLPQDGVRHEVARAGGDRPFRVRPGRRVLFPP